ncbi:metallophosphatase [Bacteroidia bacterium]|nr:metallophosphatase [Bacteroidia bacterium]
MKKTFVALLMLAVTVMGYGQKPILKFKSNGNFKIVQFTDVHYKKLMKESEVAIQLINEVLDTEKPDLVVFTGDIIWAKPVFEGLDDVFDPVSRRGIPWAYVFGNHDDEFGVSRQQLMDYATRKPYCLAQAGDKSLSGVGNYILEVRNAAKPDSIGSLLYFFDSGAYTPIKEIGGYDWLRLNQVNWFSEQSAAYTKANNNNPYPALAFFHIPLAEYPIMKNSENAQIIGSKDEKECNGRINTGMFAAIRQAGDVMGTFVGHDHNNDYIGEYFGIYLAYGRYSGGKTVYNDLGKNGCRVIELKEGKHEFSTYIRLLGGEKLYLVHYPETFKKAEK